MKGLVCIATMMLSALTSAGELIEFQAGQTAKASDVNQNFTMLEQAIKENSNGSGSQYLESTIYWTSYDFNNSNTNWSVTATATCPSDTVITGGGVWCSTDGFNSNTTNWASASQGWPAGNSFIGTCHVDTLTFSPSKYGPPIKVHAVCTATRSNLVSAFSPSSKLDSLREPSISYSESSISTGELEISSLGQGEMDEAATTAYNKVKAQLEERAALLQ